MSQQIAFNEIKCDGTEIRLTAFDGGNIRMTTFSTDSLTSRTFSYEQAKTLHSNLGVLLNTLREWSDAHP